VLLSVGIHTDKCVIYGLLSVWIRTAVCASIYHTIHTLALTLTLSLTLNPTVTLNLSLSTNTHNPICPPTEWRQGYATNCQPVPIGCTDNTRICQYAPSGHNIYG